MKRRRVSDSLSFFRSYATQPHSDNMKPSGDMVPPIATGALAFHKSSSINHHHHQISSSVDDLHQHQLHKTAEEQQLARHLHVTVSQGFGGAQSSYSCICTCTCITNYSFSLTDTAASTSAIFLQSSTRQGYGVRPLAIFGKLLKPLGT
jgi:hypothetical protein